MAGGGGEPLRRGREPTVTEEERREREKGRDSQGTSSPFASAPLLFSLHDHPPPTATDRPTDRPTANADAEEKKKRGLTTLLQYPLFFASSPPPLLLSLLFSSSLHMVAFGASLSIDPFAVSLPFLFLFLSATFLSLSSCSLHKPKPAAKDLPRLPFKGLQGA